MFTQHLIRRTLAAAAVIATAGFPSAAQAMFMNESGGSSGPVPVAPPPTSRDARSQPVASSGSSFQWGDAGIGAAGATVLLGAGALGAAATRRRRRPIVS